jgi:CheY-like chemotaxis protein
MPGLLGHELVDRVRERWPDLPVLYVSGNDGFSGLATEGAPATRFLAKPLLPAELLETVERLVDDIGIEA